MSALGRPRSSASRGGLVAGPAAADRQRGRQPNLRRITPSLRAEPAEVGEPIGQPVRHAAVELIGEPRRQRGRAPRAGAAADDDRRDPRGAGDAGARHQASTVAMKMPSASKSRALNIGLGSPEARISTRKSASATDRTPSPTSARASQNEQRWPQAGLEFLGQLRRGAGSALYRVAHDVAHVIEAGQAARRVRDRARGLGETDLAGHVQPFRHPPGPVHPHEPGALPPALPRDQHVHHVRPGRWWHTAVDPVIRLRGPA